MLPFGRFRVPDGALEPPRRAGAPVLVYRWAYRRPRPRSGDVVVLRDPEDADRYLVKRVAETKPPDRVVVLGDNRAASRDSRHFGLVGVGAIVGKVIVRARG